MTWAGNYLWETFKVDEFPIGAVKGARGMITLTGGWVDKYGTTVTGDNMNKYTKRMLVVKKNNDKYYFMPPDNNEDKEYVILCCRYVFLYLK